QSLASPPAAIASMASSIGSFTVNVCPADGNLPPNCDMANLGLIQGAEVAVYNNALVSDGIAPANGVVLLNVPAGINYTVHVQKAGYFPYYFPTLINVVAGVASPPITVILRDLSRYGSQLAGEAFVADHPVISKVIAQVADYDPTSGCDPTLAGLQCQDQSELVEIYNPTKNTYTIGTNLNVTYCNSTGCQTPAFAAHTLLPGSYLLIEGLDTAHGAPNPGGTAPDISYNVATYPPEGLIPYLSGGGVQLQVLTGTTWSVKNELHWIGKNGSGPA